MKPRRTVRVPALTHVSTSLTAELTCTVVFSAQFSCFGYLKQNVFGESASQTEVKKTRFLKIFTGENAIDLHSVSSGWALIIATTTGGKGTDHVKNMYVSSFHWSQIVSCFVTIIKGTSHKEVCTFIIISASILLRMKNITDKLV